jgi:hypothetical protein
MAPSSSPSAAANTRRECKAQTENKVKEVPYKADYVFFR